MLQNADVQRRLYERKSDDVVLRLRETELSVTRYQVLRLVHLVSVSQSVSVLACVEKLTGSWPAWSAAREE